MIHARSSSARHAAAAAHHALGHRRARAGGDRRRRVAHHLNVDTSDNTDAGFYAAGNDYFAVLAAATIDGQTVNHYLFSWSIENRSALMPTTADRRLTVESDGMGHADCKEWLGGTIATPNVTGVPKADITHLLGTAWLTPGTAGTPDVNVKLIEGADATNQIRDSIVDDATRIDASALNTASGAIGSNGSGLTEAGGTGDHLTAVPWNAAWDAEVQSEVHDEMLLLGLDHLVSTSVAGADVADNSIFARMVSKEATADWDSFDQTEMSLEALYLDLADIQTMALPSLEARFDDLEAKIDIVDTVADGIKLKTDQLTFTTANKIDATLTLATDVAAAVANRIADHVLRRNLANARASSYGDSVAFRSPLGAYSKLTNRVYISGSNLLICEENDTTTFGTQAITTDAAAEPMTAVDTA